MSTDSRAVTTGDVLASIDDRRSDYVLIGLGVVLLILAVGAGREEVYLLTVLFGIPGLGLTILPLRRGRRLVLTAEQMYLVSRSSTFASEHMQWSIPIAELGTVRHWQETRNSKGSSSTFNVHVIQVRDVSGHGYRMTQQLLSGRQLRAMQDALASLGKTLEMLERAPD